MRGAMYVEVMVPKQIRSPYPVVFFHGNGQTASTGCRRRTAVPAGPTTSSTGLRRLHGGLPDARPVAVRARP